MINQRVLVSGADDFADDFKINPYYGDKKIDVARAKAEHAEIVECFKEAGIEVVEVAPPDGCQDGVYTANWAIVKNGEAVMSRLPEARKAEELYARDVLEKLEIKTELVPDSYLYSGQGDSLICGDYLFAGSGYRSDGAAQKFVAEKFGLKLVQLHAVPQLDKEGREYVNPTTNHADSFFYDLDLALAVIDENCIAYCPEAFDEISQIKLAELPIEKIIVDLEEATQGFACNLVSTGATAIMSAHAPKFQAALEKRGLKTITPEIEELKKGGGYIRCISLTIS
ncbi:MAG: hypothetical protein LBT19_01990 [Candidatus Nomurabacteria bacterium]|jgi:N-dimethylarginine dimethylaminohydrolase|nr:hypothetical protein [Candidatus Nomurabacteria bacterium]